MDFGNFGDFSNMDPDKFLKSIEGVKAAFNKAAEADTAAQPLFEKLSTTFNKLLDGSMEMELRSKNDILPAVLKMLPAMIEMRSTITTIQKQYANDPAVGSVMADLADEIKAATDPIKDEMRKMMPGIPGLPKFPSDDAQDDRPQPPKPPQRKPRKPKDGDFDMYKS